MLRDLAGQLEPIPDDEAAAAAFETNPLLMTFHIARGTRFRPGEFSGD